LADAKLWGVHSPLFLYENMARIIWLEKKENQFFILGFGWGLLFALGVMLIEFFRTWVILGFNPNTI